MSSEDKIQRSILPIPDAQHVGLTTYDAKDPDTKFPPIEPLRPPKGAPNVLIVLIDDCGFGASSAFGGPIPTPNAERLAANGLKFNRFHTTALCSPTRQALLTGRNHHSVNMGGICEIATSAPGYTSVLPKNKAPLAMTLKLNGYSTAQFGKCHEVPVWQTSPMGPFDQWPTGGGGFEYFYGFIGGETNQWYPAIYEGTTPMEQDKSPEEGYHFTEDMTNKAIGVGAPAEGAHARQAVLHVLRARRHPRPASRAEGVDRQVQGQVRRRLGQAARRDLCPPEEAGRDPGRCRAHQAARGNPRLRRHAGGAQADSRARDGSLRRVPRTHRPSRRPPVRHAEGSGNPRRHADLLHLRRQRRLRRRHAERLLQRGGRAQRHEHARDARIPDEQDRRLRRARTPTTTTRWAGRTR